MNIDDNAIAGPSTLPDSTLPFLPPPASSSRPSPYFTSTDDLLATFNLIPAYDKYVRPFIDTDSTSIDKGKGKERDISSTPEPSSSAFPIDPDDDRKKKNNYRHLIKGISGKHSMKKDDFLTTIMQVPPKQRISITPFDARTQHDAFTVNLDGLKGWNINSLVAESPQAREDRRKRKELKKLAKIHLQPQVATASTPDPVTPTTTPTTSIPAPQIQPLQPPLTTTTPIPRTVTPKPIITQPGSRPPIPDSAPQPSNSLKRGTKREHEDSVDFSPPASALPTQQLNQNQLKSAPVAIINAKAGINGVRPRPVKKQRMDIQGQARDISVQQQPTPQGV